MYNNHLPKDHDHERIKQRSIMIRTQLKQAKGKGKHTCPQMYMHLDKHGQERSQLQIPVIIRIKLGNREG